MNGTTNGMCVLQRTVCMCVSFHGHIHIVNIDNSLMGRKVLATTALQPCLTPSRSTAWLFIIVGEVAHFAWLICPQLLCVTRREQFALRCVSPDGRRLAWATMHHYTYDPFTKAVWYATFGSVGARSDLPRKHISSILYYIINKTYIIKICPENIYHQVIQYMRVHAATPVEGRAPG